MIHQCMKIEFVTPGDLVPASHIYIISRSQKKLVDQTYFFPKLCNVTPKGGIADYIMYL